MNMKKNKNRKGFTIVELVIVIAVIAILAAVLIPTFSNVIGDANEAALKQEARNIYTKIYAADISDGVINAQEGDTAIEIPTGCTYAPNSDGTAVATFTYVKDGKTATLNISTGEWTVTP